MTWQALIGGVDYSAYTDFSSWRISQSNRHRGSQASGKVTISAKAIGRPLALQQVILKQSGGANIFNGVIQRVEQVGLNPNTYDYRLTCSDLTRWLDHLPVGGNVYPNASHSVYPGATIADAVKQIVYDWVLTSAAISDTGEIVGPSVPITMTHVAAMSIPLFGYTPNWMPVTNALDELAKMCNAVWFVDENADLWFMLPGNTDLHAPPSTTSVTYFSQDLNGSMVKGNVTETLPTIDADNPTSNVPGGQAAASTYSDLSLTEDTSAIISGVALRNYYEASTDQVTEDKDNNKALLGDGNTKFFPLYNIPIDPDHTAVTVTPTVGAPTLYTVANNNLKIEYVDGKPTDASPGDVCYVCTTNKGIRFGQAPPSGANISVNFNYYIDGFYLPKNLSLAEEIGAREGFGPGMYYLVQSDSSLTSPITLNEGNPRWWAAGEIAINRYARIKILARFKSYLTGWRPGQVFAIVSANRGDADRAYNTWGASFAQRFFVTQLERQLVNDDRILTSVEASTDIWGQ